MENTDNKKRVLVVHYSQTGQLDRVVQSVVGPLQNDAAITVDYLTIKPQVPYPFPWPFIQFINTFPEAAHQIDCPLQLDITQLYERYDLVILGYQVWFLAPSIPVSSFLNSPVAHKLLADTPVVTVIACRNMWLQAQEKVKAQLATIGAKLVGNIALVDEAGSILSFFATPLWVLTGRRGPFWFGIPRAGVADAQITAAARFGEALVARFSAKQPMDSTVLQGLGAVRINDKLIASEKIGTRSFYLWGKLFLACGKPSAWLRKPLALLYAVFLIAMIVTVVPITAVLKKLTAPLMRGRITKQKRYYAEPSGE
ncbi:dialkylrecorsinol condensing enzyme [Gilvimarinus polysaccharolyticus]|uniref:dialkylrecorsinol condensing enzyme n=1 Tax=Gilvimarinus polysaccharolyticus TaxID=863921 RepID=UPI000AFAC665|nr:dialkylrecorsinol condensing enzyme [Gilvimarinus polysaccharolyticus]